MINYARYNIFNVFNRKIEVFATFRVLCCIFKLFFHRDCLLNTKNVTLYGRNHCPDEAPTTLHKLLTSSLAKKSSELFAQM